MRERRCDVAVIGAGTAGIAAFRAARAAGADSVLIEAGPGGTTCARVGCMPSKLLITAAEAAHDARAAGRFGIRVDGVAVDGPAVLHRVRAERDRFVAGVRDGLAEEPEDLRIAGWARFSDPTTLLVDYHTRLGFRAAVIATGSSPTIPEPLRAFGDAVLTTDTLFESADLPRSLAVLGGGAVGLEIAQAMARLGVAVTLIDSGDHLAGIADYDLNRQAITIFGAEMALQLGCSLERVARAGDGLRLTWTRPGGATGSLDVHRVLAATGRSPVLADLGLDRAGITLSDKGLPRFDPASLLCEGGPVLIAGDANAARPVLHEAARQGGLAGRNAAALAASRPLESPAPWTQLSVVFTHPQVGRIGDPDAAEAVLTGTTDLSDQGRARIMGRNAGAIRLRAARDGTLLGAEMIGPAVEHLAHLLAFAIQDGHTARTLLDRPFYHPTVEEGFKAALRQIVARADADRTPDRAVRP